MSTPAQPPPPPPHLPPMDDEESRARKGKNLVIAGLITSAASLLFCPCIGHLAGGGLAYAGQQTTPAGRRPSLGRLPLATYVLSAVGLLVWTAVFAVSAAMAPKEEKVVQEAPATTTSSTEVSAPPSTASPATTLPVPAGDAELLAALRVAPENDPGTYNRELFNYPDGVMDSRGCNTRSRVLERDSTLPAQVTYPGCKVLAGRWVDSYTGVAYENPAEVSIDHLVALKEAYSSGASSWSPPMMVAFANDVERREALRVIGGPGNAEKGDKDPAEWKPPLQPAWPDYARSWAAVKVAYGLTADQAEVDALRTMLTPPPPVTTPPTTAQATAPPTVAATAPPTTRAPATTRAPTTAPPTTAVYYANCAAAKAAGAAPIRRGEPGYRQALDRDGVICTQ